MAVRRIITHPDGDATLRRQSVSLARVNRRARLLAEDMKETLLHHEHAVGLAAPQIGVNRRMIAVRLDSEPKESPREPRHPLILIDPQIIAAADEREDFDGCLSLPGLYGRTVRPHRVQVRARDEKGALVERTFEGFDAVVLHHEIDHLDGILFIDRIESVDDLYRVREDEEGNLVRVPVTAGLSQALSR